MFAIIHLPDRVELLLVERWAELNRTKNDGEGDEDTGAQSKWRQSFLYHRVKGWRDEVPKQGDGTFRET